MDPGAWYITGDFEAGDLRDVAHTSRSTETSQKQLRVNVLLIKQIILIP